LTGSQTTCGVRKMVYLLELNVKGGITTGTTRRIMNYYLLSKYYIPATTLSGAIMNTVLKKEGKMRQVYTSPALPIVNNKPVVFSHYFSPSVSRKAKDYVEIKGGLRRTDANSLRERFPELKHKIGELIVFDKEDGALNYYKQYEPETEVEMEVAIDRTLGSARKGLLYAYEVLIVDKMWALSSEGFEGEISLGRGKNRYYPTVEVRVKKEVELREVKEGDVVYCLTPCVPTLFGKKFIEFDEIWGEYSLYTGWFTTDNIAGQKPVFRVLREGSLIKVKKVLDDRLLNAGLNLLLPIEDLGEIVGWFK